ncbi:mandelate racemase [Sulfodiicoccus acidiphilus]|uniref:Mandelate racemase n=1 Tax=Sulfodiicoccus acidiphilus TaxID=1670455 RepID=A0A348B5I2_9CREN|nr:mandelate racemase/muconate lactonizing enzyme family protein [Sulfodiicoccus acidiphilus]BBD73434.1 mandelate racemase [Sulfodiicoccus acidiphilus]GGT98565.1 mandelate racemase [Sulfodiicoccus acidiphilus]
MKARTVEVGLYRVPSRHVQENAIARFTHYEWVLVKLTFNGGVEGVGFTYTQGRGGGAVFSLLSEYWAKELLTSEELDPLTLNRKARSMTYSYGLEGVSRIAYAALDIALWDAEARAQDVPLYRLLGGPRNPKVRAYRSAIDLNFTVQELVEDVKKFKEMGFRAFKIKVGKPELEEDLSRIRAVREVIGKDPLMVDANRGWSFTEALRRGRAMEDLVYWLEEPIEAELLDEYKELRGKLRVPIAAGESLYSSYEQTKLITEGCVDVVQLDVLRSGGVTEWMRYAQLADSLGLPVAPHFGEEISVQVLSAVRNAMFLEHLPGSNLNDSGLLRKGLRFEEGYALPPDGPGHGLEFDWDRLKSYQVKYEKVT